MQNVCFKIVIFLLIITGFSVTSATAARNKKVTIEINFNGEKESLKIETDWQKGLSALEALQFVAEVKTHPVQQFVFVTEINGVEGVPNQSVWYYKINGQPAKKLAIWQPLKKADVVTWIYKKDVCSPKIKSSK